MSYEEEEDETKSPDEKILASCRKNLRQQIDDEDSERQKMRDDLNFCTLDQWPAEIRRERENDLENGPRPCLTIDKINQYIVQVVNDMRQGKPGINVRPQDDQADPETAKILKGLIRNIEDQSSADIAYASAGESAAKIGLGYFRITTEYAGDDSFDQEIFIKPLPNTFAVYLGPHVMPDGSDAKRAWIVEVVPVAKFKEEFPGKKSKPDEFDDLGEQQPYWHTGETITVVEEYCIERVRKTLNFLADGTTMTDEDYGKWPADGGERPAVQNSRETFVEQLKWCKMTGVEVLDKRDLPGKYIPVVEVIGRESNIGGKRYLWGLVRPAKDSLRMYNYFASTITEKMGLAPKAPFVGAKGQFEGLEAKWKKANRVNYAYLEYNPIDVNGNAIPAPERVGATPMEAALLNQMQVIEHDVQTSLGMFKAATGESESQQSGRAILALQRESDTGTYHFGANLGLSIRQAGRIIVDMIPHYYDTKRVVRILGDDGEVKTAQLDPEQQMAHQQVQGPQGLQSIYNPGVGKYDVSISVGPSYNTKRMEAAATFVEMSKGAADPASAAVLRYLVMRNSDTAGSDEAAKLLKALLPPQALQALESNAPIPPQVQAMMAQMQAKDAARQEEFAKLQQENMQLKAGTQSDMMKIQADSQAQSEKTKLAIAEANAELTLQKQKQDGELQLAREKAAAEIEIKQMVAAADAKLAGEKLDFDRQVGTAKFALDKENSDREHSMKMEQENKSKMNDVSPKILQTLERVVESQGKQKKISITMPDGRKMTADVQ
mgnify:FL=1